ncbi:MAG: hypothetical protein WA990_01805 [Rubrobacteraceae bacterium]
MRAMRVIEKERGRYEVLEVPYGKSYSWSPGRARIECDCGVVVDLEGPLEGSGAVCECGAELEGISEGPGLEVSGNEGGHRPWLEEYEEWREQKEAKDVRCEYYAFVEAKDE